MSQGKFSNPRPYREEEREIEKAYRDLTRQQSHKTYEHTVTPEDLALAGEPLPPESEIPDIPEIQIPEMPQPESTAEAEERQIEEAFQKITGKPIPPKPAPPKNATPKPRIGPTFEVLPEEPDFSPEEPERSGKRSGWMDEAMDFYRENGKLVLAALCALSVAVILFVILLFARSAKDPYGEKILPNVYIADMNVGGMTKKEAVALLNTQAGDVYASEDMVIELSGTKLVITPKDSGISLDANGAVEEAYAYGRTGSQADRDADYKASKTQPHNIAILPYLNLKSDNIRKFLTDKAGNAKNTLVQSTYGLEGPEPQLAADKFDKNAPTQTLVITLGKPGVGFDPQDVYNQVLDAYSDRVFLVTVENVETLRDPDPIDLEKIYREFYIAPVNASVDTAGSYGYEFDKKAAQALLDAAKFGEEVRIPMQYIEPDVADANAFFRDTLGEYQTRATGSDERISNLRVACESINGRVLNPGESLSFRDAVGQLSASRGFQSAPEDIGMESVLGGGASQVSSTLYCAALLSDLTVTSRSNLPQVPSFIDSGLDANVNLTLKNGLNYPVRVDAKVSGGYVRISIVGTEQRDYYCRLSSETVKTYKAEEEYVEYPFNNSDGYRDGDVLQEGRDGYQVKSYLIRYDRRTDQRLGSDYIAASEYQAVPHIYAKIELPPETTEETLPPETEPPTEETVSPPTEESLPSYTEETHPHFEDDENLDG